MLAAMSISQRQQWEEKLKGAIRGNVIKCLRKRHNLSHPKDKPTEIYNRSSRTAICIFMHYTKVKILGN